MVAVYEYDVFISHASADKADVAVPLKDLLQARGCKVWFDNTTLTIGDNLRRKIDEGLSLSRYGIIVLSPHFFAKQWPQYELDGLLAREMADAVKVILPVWHRVSRDDVMRYSAPLSLRLGGNTNDITLLGDELADVILGASDRSSEPQDDVSLAKRAILTCALSITRIFLMEGPDSRYVRINGVNFNKSEKQRKLFLYALSELEKAGLAEHVEKIVHELTYEGIQVAERMEPLPNPEKLGT